MKNIFKIFILLLITGFTSLQAQDQVSNSANDEKLFVIKVPIDASNQTEINELKKVKVEDVVIQEANGHLTLQYLGTELISEVSPDFVEGISVYKGDKAKQRYPNGPAGGVIEIVVLDAKSLSNVIHSIKSN